MTDDRIQHYRLLHRLGAGGMGEVYLAEDPRLGRRLALKLLPAEFAQDASRRARFLIEARAAAALNHPNICTVYDAGQTAEGRLFIALELLEGETLDVRLNGGPLEVAEVVRIGVQLASVMEAAHAKGILHRDLKPSNLHLDARGHLKVLDFGLAKRLVPEPGSAEDSTRWQTRAGGILGTPQYMSPEQAMGRALDPRSDLFSCGAVLYELLTGRGPFSGQTFAELLEQIVHRPPEAIARFNYAVPAELERVVLKCLQKDPDQRYQSARELAVDLRSVAEQSRGEAVSDQPGPAQVVTWVLLGTNAEELERTVGVQETARILKTFQEAMGQRLRKFSQARQEASLGSTVLLSFARPSNAAQWALEMVAVSQGPLQCRAGLHLGEVAAVTPEAGEQYGGHLTVCERLLQLARPGQVLMGRAVFDSARQVLPAGSVEGAAELSWVSHGPYLFEGIEGPLEVCEVGAIGRSPLSAPKTSDKAQRQVRPDEEPVLGWRPAVGQAVPNTPWVLEEKLGEGGFGEVWVAQHPKLRERRVFKFCFWADRVRALKRELTLFRLLKEHVGDHRNIVKLYEVYLDEPPFYLEEEYVEGKDLKTWCEAQGGVDNVLLETRLEIVAQAAEALQAAHDAGIIHRDVKPGNILVRDQGSGVRGRKTEGGGQRAEDSPSDTDDGSRIPDYGVRNVELTSPGAADSPSSISHLPSSAPLTVKLTDFGIGQVISAEYLKGVTQAGFTQTMLGSTSSGTGTTMYLAPEIVAGSPATTRSDLYSLGVVLYQLLTGDFRRPLTADWTRDVDDPLLREDLQSCLAGRASDRFAGAIQLARHLRELPARRARLREQQAAVEQAARAAARRAAIRTAAVAAGLVIAFAWLAGAAIVQGRRARASAEAAAQQREIAEQRLYAADLSLATRAREDGQSGRLHDLLERHRPSATNPVDRRDWLWRWLWVQSRSDEVRTLSHSGDQSRRLCYSPDGRLLIAGGRDGELTVWDTTTWELVKRLALQSGLRSLDVSPDGKWLAAVGGGRLRVWDLQTGELQDEAEVNQSWGWDIDRGGGAARFTARSDLLLLGDTGVGQLHFRDFHEHRTIHSLDLHRRGISALAVSADGRLLASAALGPEIRLWEFQGRTNLTLVRPIESGDGGLLFDLAFAPSGNWLAGAGLSGPGWAGTYCRAWQVDLTNVFHDLEGHSGWVGGARFTLDGQSLLTVGADQTVRLWNAEDWKLAGRFQGHLNEVLSLAVSPDGRSFATGDRNSEVKIWDLFNHGDDRHTLLIQDRVERFIASVDRTGFATRNDQGTVQFWDSASLEALPTPALPPGEIWSLDLRGGFAVIGSNRVELVNLRDGTARELSAEVTPFFRFHTHLSADGRFLFFPEQHATRMLRLPEAVAVASLEEPGELLPAAISARGRYALFRTPERANLRLWDFHLLRTYPITLGGPRPTGVHARFSPNEELCATVGSHGVLHLFKLEATGPRLCALIDPNLGALSNLDFSPDGRTLVVATVPGRLWFLDLGSLQESGKVGGYRCMYQGPHTTVAFSNDGKNLIVHDIYRQSVYALRAPSLAEIDATAKPLASVAPATIP